MGACLRLENVDVIAIVLASFLALIFVGTIWFLGETLGEFIPISVWLLIVGLLGIVALVAFLKIRE